MHPQLIPEKHPKCGKVMEALMECRKEHPWRKYWGVCNDITYQLTKCLAEEKKEFRAPRQAKFQEKWKAKKEADAARLAALEAEAEARRAAKAAAEQQQQMQQMQQEQSQEGQRQHNSKDAD